ncbi:sensor histidine kinase [Mucilaginibacter aquaedulcis]|uniref:sensor histidine kinase n=1 Tax=Mucilaginibacter aquaedulcis TaxID=1187081 RepID=UPI0025B4EF6F|nr:7TM diverse intracellular signaling domain-containing protein [Mucilaginibacter aquaedulcis]MDN3548653.1 7TM diverse intracellular signaling domain-containing protein [Mucilaginibacter aquaedulcis]
MGQKIIHFNGENKIIGQYVSILEDSTNRKDLQSVIKSPHFTMSHTQVPNLKLSTSDFWLRFTIKNESQSELLLLNLEYPTLELCSFYYPVNGVYYSKTLSDTLMFNDRKYKHQDFIFDAQIPKDSTVTFYLRVRSNEQMVLPLVIGTPQKIAELKLSHDMFWGGLVGLLLVMTLYNAFVFLSTRDISYLYYVCYTVLICLTQTSLSGYTYRFLFADSPEVFNAGIILFPALAGIALLLFTESFLGVSEKIPLMGKVFKFIMLFYVVAMAGRLLGFKHTSYRMIDICALLLTVCVYIVVVRLAIKGFRPARLFLLAWTMFLVGVILFVLRNLGVLPYNNLTNYTMQTGTALEVTLLSLALADRINIFKADKEKSQAETVSALQENERIIREQNAMLEHKVQERTGELIASNGELNRALDDLKQTQSQLVEAEKMASLGQLTAGIAHEINNPINFVSSNIKPLKRDIDMVLDAITEIENIGLSAIPAEEKKKQLKAYKDENDFDYVLAEIKHLLKGINEGASRTTEIVKGLKIFSRLDEDNLKSADLNEGMESTILIANNMLHGIEVIKSYSELPKVECFAGKLNQVFLNIISNAAYAVRKKYGEAPGAEIEITSTSDDQYAIFSIKDNGIGMSETTKNKIFEPFFTTKEVGEGTGLGMSIAYNTIKKHHGKILVDSYLDEGTEFTIYIPLVADWSIVE